MILSPPVKTNLPSMAFPENTQRHTNLITNYIRERDSAVCFWMSEPHNFFFQLCVHVFLYQTIHISSRRKS